MGRDIKSTLLGQGYCSERDGILIVSIIIEEE